MIIRHKKIYNSRKCIYLENVKQRKDLFGLAIIHTAQDVLYLYCPDISVASLITVVGACKSYWIACINPPKPI